MSRPRDDRHPEDRPFGADAAKLEQQLHGRNNGFSGRRNIRDVRLLTKGETAVRRLRPGAQPVD